ARRSSIRVAPGPAQYGAGLEPSAQMGAISSSIISLCLRVRVAYHIGDAPSRWTWSGEPGWLADWLDLAEHCGSLVRCRGCSGAGGRLAVEPSLICRLRHSRWDGVGDLAHRA